MANPETASREAFTADDRAALDDSLRRLLADRCAEADVRRVMQTPEGFDRGLWDELARMGIVGLVVGPEHGGAGGGPVELEQVMEAVGAALLPGPLLSSGVLAAELLRAIGDPNAQERLLPRIASGQCIATVAITGPAGGWREKDVGVVSDGERLSGEATYVTCGQIADVLLVVGRARDGFGVFEIAAKSPSLTVNPLPTFDRTLRLASVTFDSAQARRLAADGPVWPAVEQALDLARLALAGEQAGGARRILEMTVAYAKARHQFGRPIGSFQAIKHMAADLFLESESAISAARHAAEALADGSAEAPAALSLAAFACSDAFVAIAAAAIQMHGGVAFTWDHPAHLYLRRARADAQLFGDAEFHRERWLRRLEDEL